MDKVFGPALKVEETANAASAIAVGTETEVRADADGADKEAVDTPAMTGLARIVMDNFRVNWDARENNGVNERLRYALSAQTCKYDGKQKEYLRKIGVRDRVYAPLTATKVRAAKAMLIELANYGTEDMFALDPTPVPEVPDEVAENAVNKVAEEIGQAMQQVAQSGAQEIPPEAFSAMRAMVEKASEESFDYGKNAEEAFARHRANRLQKKVADILVQGNFKAAQAKCIENVCTYGTCVMVGPVMRNVAHNKMVKNRKTGVYSIKRVISAIPWFESINPEDCYPAPDSENVTDGMFCARVKYTREELWRFRKATAKAKGGENETDGWRDNAIALILSRHEKGCKLWEFMKDPSVEDAQLQTHDSTDSCKFEGVRAFGYVEGSALLEIGLSKSYDGKDVEADEFYCVEVIVIDGTVVYCRINDERVGIPISKGVFYELPGSWWGESIADKLYAVQTVMNNAVVSLLRNMGPASAPMVWIQDVSRLTSKAPDALTAEPGKVFAFNSPYSGQGTSGVPMGVLQLPSNAAELRTVADWATKQSDLDSGIPAFAEGTGSSNGGALRTAEGLRTYTEASSRGMKTVMTSFDNGVICTTIRRVADWVLANDDDMNLKGDVEVRPVGVMGRLHKAQNDQARVQLLNLCLNSQFMTQLLGVNGIVEMFRPSCVDIGINPDNVCPSPERMEMLEMLERVKQAVASMAPAMAAAGGAGGGMAAAQAQQQQEIAEGEGNRQVEGVPQVGGGVEGRRSVA